MRAPGLRCNPSPTQSIVILAVTNNGEVLYLEKE